MRCINLIFLLVGGVQSSTLYQWIVDSQTRFNYDPNPNNMLGVYNWPRTYGEDCGGMHQSPIDIQTDLVRYGVSCQCPRMIYSSNMLRGKFKNNGHSAEFEPEEEVMLQLTNVPYRPGMYKLHDFHLHYGGVTGRDFELQGLRFRGSGIMSAGSEHTINGLRFEGELHFVFYNSKYKDLEEADNKTDGVVVICVLIQKLQGIMSDSTETSRFSEFIEMNIPRIFPYQANASTEVDLSIFFNRDCEFYTYPGSTTTPTCHESVRWIILKDPIMVTERAWFTLTGLQSRGDFNSRFGNYRTTQPLNDRVIEANFDRPNGPVLPSPNGEAMLMMMMDVMNMTMEMMNQDLNLPNMNGNAQDIPMMLMERTASSPVGNVRDMPLMMMSMLNNANVPNLSGNVRDMPMMMPIQRIANVPNLNGNVRDRTMMMMMPMQRNENVPNLNGNVRQMPMMMMPMQTDGNLPNLKGNERQMPMMMTPMQKDGNVPKLNGNVREMPMMMMPMQKDGNVPNLNGNVRELPMMMMPMQKDGNVPNLNGNVQQMPAMMMQMQRNGNMPNMVLPMPGMMSQLNSPNIPNLIETFPDMTGMMPMQSEMMMMMPQDMRAQTVPEMRMTMIGQPRDANLPNLDGNVRGRAFMGMPSRPTFDRNILRTISRDISRSNPNLNGNERTQRRPSNQAQTAISRQTPGTRNRNRNNNMNDENNNNNNNTNNNNRNNNRNNNNNNRNVNNNNRNSNVNGGRGSRMMNNMRGLQPFLWNLRI